DLAGGASTVLASGVRAFEARAPYVVWQALGDDLAEPIFLHDVRTGADLPLGRNEFCQQSWGRGGEPTGLAGRWRFDLHGRFLALHGADGVLAAVHHADTGEPLEVPPHVLWD